MLRNWGPFLFTLIAGLVLALLAVTPPSPKSANAPSDQFSSARAMQDVRIIAANPHPTGSEDNAKVRAYLVNRLTALGLEVSESESLVNERGLKRLNGWSGESKTEQALFNVIGILPGKDRSQKAVLLMAHHDTVWGSPGAADDTAGVASILEIIRAVKDMDGRDRDIIVLFTDAEEIGLVGAKHFFKEHPLRDKIGAVINLEARGGSGTANMFQTSRQNGQAARLYAKAVSEPSATSVSVFVYNILPNDTDLTPALEKDYAAFNIANIGTPEYYHSPKIDADALSESTLQHMGSQGLDLTRALMTADTMPKKAPDATFFDAFGLFTVIYAPFWGWIFLAAAALLYAASVRHDMKPKQILTGCLKMAGFILIGAAMLYGLNSLSGHGSSADYYDRLAAIPKLELTALFLVLAMFLVIFGAKDFKKNEQIGLVLPLFLLGIMGQAYAPTAAYFITLALLFCAAASFAKNSWPDKVLSQVIISLSAAIVFGYMVFLGHFLMLGVGPDMLSAVILPAAIAAAALAPVYTGLSNRLSRYAALGCLGLSIVLALWVRLDPIASTIPLY